MLGLFCNEAPSVLSSFAITLLNNIRIYHECEGRIEKFRPDDRRFASRGLLSDDKR